MNLQTEAQVNFLSFHDRIREGEREAHRHCSIILKDVIPYKISV
jgi:hypothetical protein